MAEQSKQDRKASHSPFASALEPISAGLGLLLAVGIGGVIGWDALSGNQDGPPALSVRAAEIRQQAGTYVVRIRARNEADATAAAVLVEGQLREGGATVETSQATISYVPGHSERRAGLIFRRDPRARQLVLRVAGYEEP